MIPRALLACFLLTFLSSPVLATQGHTAPEGLYVHQFAHIFFMISMGILIYWLRERNLIREKGWKFIQYSAMFFILWNLDAVAVHFLEEQSTMLEFHRLSTWQIRIDGPTQINWLKLLYYGVKHDHLLCVPAMVLLYAGLKRILRQSQFEKSGKELP